MSVAPIRRTVRTKVSPELAFDVFTGKIGLWWPKGDGVGAEPLVEVVLEPGVGGRWYERDAADRETQWGHVLEWAPPGRLVLAWQIDREKRFDPGLVTEVEVTFKAAPDGGAEVSLEHRDLERFGRDAGAWLRGIGGGWTEKLGQYADFVHAANETA